MSRLALLAVAAVAHAPPLPAADADAEFFEKRVRPVLVEHCYKCHSGNGKEPKGGLRVDGRGHLLKGGDGGPSVVPGSPDKSKLIEAVRYANVDLHMPPKGKLPPAVIADLEKWVAAGAPWPGDAGVQVEPGPAAFDLAERKKAHWSWQPVRPQTPPAVKNAAWPADPADRFLLAKLEAAGLAPAPPADPRTLLRRLTFALTGLPPTPAEVAAFDRNPSVEKAADRLLASPAFGERWGRHWLDLVRYGESRGHEFDPDIPNAWQYRDYVVRALNADVPYDRLVREHVAGDVLPDPRLGPDGANESILGTGFWHLGEEVHSPVDIRQDQADRLDNRIDVFTKAFLGLTVSCARCHDHKFDAIPTRDFYALYGLLEGSGYRQVRFDGWAANRTVAADLAAARAAVPRLPANPAPADAKFRDWLARGKVVFDPAAHGPDDWRPDDVTFGPAPRPAGTVFLRPGPDGSPQPRVETRTAAAFDRFWAKRTDAPDTGKEHGSLGKSPRAGFSVRTPNFVLERDNVYFLLRGGGTAYAAVCGHTVIAGPLHGALIQHLPDAPDYRWGWLKLKNYRGQRLHFEFAADPKTDFAVALVVQSDTDPPGNPPAGCTPPPALPPEVTAAAEKLAAAEKALADRAVWRSRLAPALWDGDGVDEAVFVRGNPRTPGEVVPRRFLEALAGPQRIAHAAGSGRLELARQLTDPGVNPFLARVAVNRVWHHLFGRGLVASADNFGVLGDPPTHPELLDYLAVEFVRDGWSVKRLIRRLVLTRAYGMSSDGPAPDADPANLLLHKFRLKRLEGEAIRDAVLAVSGRLDPTVGGKPVPIHLTQFLDGRGRPGSGPLDGAGRRSLYLACRRNFLSPFLLAFDTPIPFSTVGRRQVSNVPAQALILLNDPFVHGQAAVWAKRVLAEPGGVEERLTGMYVSAFGRPPTPAELADCRGFVAGREPDAAAWTDLAHTLFNVKEFVFVR